MCTVLLRLGVNPIVVNKYINTINRSRNDPRGGIGSGGTFWRGAGEC